MKLGLLVTAASPSALDDNGIFGFEAFVLYGFTIRLIGFTGIFAVDWVGGAAYGFSGCRLD